MAGKVPGTSDTRSSSAAVLTRPCLFKFLEYEGPDIKIYKRTAGRGIIIIIIITTITIIIYHQDHANMCFWRKIEIFLCIPLTWSAYEISTMLKK
jgi:hypothetical protein